MDNKTKIIGNIVGVPNPKSDWAQGNEKKSDYIKNRTHYSESVLLCDYTHTLDMENWDGSDYGGTFTLDKEVEPDSLRLYINGEYVPVKYRTADDIDYAFYIDAQENDIFTYNKSNNHIDFFVWIEKGNYKLYEEIVHQLDEKYIPENIARTQYVEDKMKETRDYVDKVIDEEFNAEVETKIDDNGVLVLSSVGEKNRLEAKIDNSGVLVLSKV